MIDDTLKLLLMNIRKYLTIEDIAKVYEAFEFAKHYHEGQYRESGEEYIIHPLTVSFLLSEYRADVDTLCAALLHDTLEDTKASYNEIEEIFGTTVAKLVDGVTKYRKDLIPDKNKNHDANIRKMLLGSAKDVRIILIRLADRLHNMRTLEFKKDAERRKEISYETTTLYAPIANYLGLYNLKNQLEDLAFSHIDKNTYNTVCEKISLIKKQNEGYVTEMMNSIAKRLQMEYIMFRMEKSHKNAYGVFKMLNNQIDYANIHDLISMVLITSDVSNCYNILGIVHSLFTHDNNELKDYLCNPNNPKPNGYKSLHTTVLSPGNSRKVQALIRTEEMDIFAKRGLAAYWEPYYNKSLLSAEERMNEDFKKSPFFNAVNTLDSYFTNDDKFVERLHKELLGNKINIILENGDIIELPEGSNILDLYYNNLRYYKDIPYDWSVVAAIINGKKVGINHELKNNDNAKLIMGRVEDSAVLKRVKKTYTTSARAAILNSRRHS